MQVKTFISTFNGTLDGKGRVCVPALYRQILSAQETPGVFLSQAVSDPAIECFGIDVLDTLNAELEEKNPILSAGYEVLGSVLSEILNLPFDENGRVRLSEDLIAYAGLKDRVVFVGVGKKFQIFDPDRYALVRIERRKLALAQKNGGTP
jgi:MraZ protein